jgi:hypothetical protein
MVSMANFERKGQIANIGPSLIIPSVDGVLLLNGDGAVFRPFYVSVRPLGLIFALSIPVFIYEFSSNRKFTPVGGAPR